MDKKGQFYIIAAIIIIIVLIGMAGVSNYVTIKKEPSNFYDLGKNLGLEGAWVIDYGIYNSIDDLNQKIEEFARQYVDYAAATGEEFELAIAYGDPQKGGKAIKYVRSLSGEDCSTLGESKYCIPNYDISEESLGDLSTISQFVVADTVYEIDVKQNQNFIFVLTTSKGFEKYVYDNR